jgi:LmbE family N-acetylglucosaminyl deacetylase
MLGSPYKFAQHGRAGGWFGETIPHLASVADDITVVRSMWTDQFNHAPAELMVHTGNMRAGNASMGSWVTYGLGSVNQDLPGFVVLLSGGTDPTGGKSLWGSGFLPGVYQGTQCRTTGEPILFANNPAGMSRDSRRRTLDALKTLNEAELKRFGDPETRTRIEQYELAYRMQVSVPDVFDIGKEPERIRNLYGAKPGEGSFANNCLLARRLVEKGTRYVQLYDWGWDIHGTSPGDDLMEAFPKKCRDVDQACAGAHHRPEAARDARRDAGDLGWRIRPYAHERGARRLNLPRARPSSGLLHHVVRWRRHQTRPSARRDGRFRLRHRRRQGDGARPADDGAASARAGCPRLQLPLSGAGQPPDRADRRGPRREGNLGVSGGTRLNYPPSNVTRLTVLLAALLGLVPTLRADAPAGTPTPAPKQGEDLLKTDVLGIFAHPDDETGCASVFARYALGEHKTVTAVSCARGRGRRQHAVGTQAGDALGVLREQELLDCLNRLGAVAITSSNRTDFGYTENLNVAMEKWDHRETLRRLVRNRPGRCGPEVIVTMNPAPTPGQHGNHQAAGMLALQAYDLAGDPAWFPEQLATDRAADLADAQDLDSGGPAGTGASAGREHAPLADGRTPAQIAREASSPAPLAGLRRLRQLFRAVPSRRATRWRRASCRTRPTKPTCSAACP